MMDPLFQTKLGYFITKHGRVIGSVFVLSRDCIVVGRKPNGLNCERKSKSKGA